MACTASNASKRPAKQQQLADGTFQTRIYPSQKDQRARRGGELARVVEYQLDDPGLPEPQQRYRLLCTILDEQDVAPGAQRGALYHERWELENALDELKAHQRAVRALCCAQSNPRASIKKPTATSVLNYAIRRLLHDAALRADPDPDRSSFTSGLRAVRRSARTGLGLPPEDLPRRMITRSSRSWPYPRYHYGDDAALWLRATSHPVAIPTTIATIGSVHHHCSQSAPKP